MHTLSEAQSDPPTGSPSRVAVDEKQIEVDGEKKWLYAAIHIDSRLLFEVDVFSRRGTDPAAAFLHRLTDKHNIADAEFLVDAAGYLTALVRRELSGQLNYRERNHIEKWFHTVTMLIDRFHSFWRGSQADSTARAVRVGRPRLVGDTTPHESPKEQRTDPSTVHHNGNVASGES